MVSALALPGPGDPFVKLVLLVHEMIPQWLEILYRPTLNVIYSFLTDGIILVISIL